MTRIDLNLIVGPLIGIVATIVLHGAPASAQAMCGNRIEMVENLADKYGEEQMSLGMAGSNLFETWANCLTGTWTILKTFPNGRACLVVWGGNWRSKDCKLRGDFT